MRPLWLLGVALYAAVSHAQVPPTTSITLSGPPGDPRNLGTSVTPQGGGVHYITGGTRSGPAGPNLFHSFGTFTIGPGDVANFRNDSGLATSNVIGRVTDGVRSDIWGTIRTNDLGGFGAANLFLINPAGWLFGPSAVLEVGGSFHASTAHYLSFSPNERFYADPARESVLSSADPVAFGFLGPTAPIIVSGSFLSVPDGKTLSLVGGNVDIGMFVDPATEEVRTPVLFAPGGGRIQIGSFASAGEAAVDRLTGGFSAFGEIRISGSALIDASENFDGSTGGGSIIIRGGKLFVDASFINANTYGYGLLEDGETPIGGAPIEISMAESITLTNGAGIRTTASADFGFGMGRGGDIRIDAPDVSIDGSFVVAGTSGTGPGGNVSFNVGNLAITGGGGVGSLGGSVTIDANQSVSISGRDVSETPSSLFTSTENDHNAGVLTLTAKQLTMSDFGTITSNTLGGQGDPLGPPSGNIVVTVDRLSITGGANIDSHTGSSTPGGWITVTVNDAAVIAGSGSGGSPSGIFSDSCAACAGAAGDITLRTGSFTLTQGAQIQSGSTADPQGGDVSITARDSILISDGGGVSALAGTLAVGQVLVSASDLAVDGGFISATALGEGKGGDIVVQAGTVNLLRGGKISSNSGAVAFDATGQGGSIAIDATNVSITGAGSGLFSAALRRGDAGQIRVSAPIVTLANGGRIDSSTLAGGAGGAVEVNGALTIGGSGSGLFSTASGTGDAGAIAVTAPTLTLADGARISVTTAGAGDAGTITANVGSFSITGGGRVDSSTTAGGAGGAIAVSGTLSVTGTGSGLFSTASGTGAAGAIVVAGPTLTLTDGARVSVTTEGSGRAGTITANVGDLGITGGARVDSSTSSGGAGGAITVNGTLAISGAGSGLFSTASGTGDAGAIDVTAPSLTVTGGGTIDSSSTAGGAGGAINLSAASQVEISSGGSVRADSLGGGNTGSITIAAGDRIIMESGSISTRAATSDGGNITLKAPNIIRLGNSQITTSVESGTGGGGNIFIDPQFVILQGSTITANAFGGPGGSITIVADNFLTDAASVVQASSALSTPGTIRIQSPENNLKEAIAQLPAELVDASRLMRAGCAARLTGATSSLAVAGRGGVPADADGYLPSFSTTGAPLVRAVRQEERGEPFVLAMASWDCMR